ncbi:beta-1,3-galactosyltransferase 5 isoform X3 [Elephas maximus indicus]|uniref:beta-1,3-galactosyltransferase 5 isoform X3 n=1 Tax=Elephas maximus indicus TaxID=99487 RepID=UPI002116355C|nr:beta-1,3-galactosyltransferase 5 isoform X3 [Elephas maximus indicus]
MSSGEKSTILGRRRALRRNEPPVPASAPWDAAVSPRPVSGPSGPPRDARAHGIFPLASVFLERTFPGGEEKLIMCILILWNIKIGAEHRLQIQIQDVSSRGSLSLSALEEGPCPQSSPGPGASQACGSRVQRTCSAPSASFLVC